MSEREAFLRAIRENPADDTARLVYADWLDENATTVPCPNASGKVDKEGQHWVYELAGPDSRWVLCPACCGSNVIADGNAARAEFIRVQCELAKWPGLPAERPLLRKGTSVVEREYAEKAIESGVGRLRLRERELWGSWPDADDIRSQIHREMPQIAHPSGWAILPATWMEPGYFPNQPAAVISRGFVSAVSLPAAVFLGGECVRCRGEGNLYYVEDDADEDAACPECFGTGHTPGVARELFATHPVERVTLPGVVRGGMIFRNSSGGGGISPDLTRDQWELLGLSRCSSPLPDCVGAGTHAHIAEDEFSRLLVRHGRSIAGLPT